MRPPAELSLGSDALEVVLLPELGARIHRLRAFGHDLLRTPADPRTHADDPFFWGAYVMAPWCNRAPAGPTEVAGRTVDLAPNFGDGSAIHGQVSASPWTERADGSLRVGGGGGADGWPWPYEVIARATVDARSLNLAYDLVNRSDAPMPAGIGLHPWFRRPVEVLIPADSVYPGNAGSTPDPEPVAGALDFRVARVPEVDLDATWSALAVPRIELAWPDARIAVSIELEATRVLVAAASPSALDAVAVEPQTHGPDGLRRLVLAEPDAPTLLAPGEALHLGLRLTVERLPS